MAEHFVSAESTQCAFDGISPLWLLGDLLESCGETCRGEFLAPGFHPGAEGKDPTRDRRRGVIQGAQSGSIRGYCNAIS